MKDVDQLIYLYSQAIEYYDGMDDAKHASFYQKTQKLLNKPTVFNVMKKSKSLLYKYFKFLQN